MHKIRALCLLIRTETLKKATAGRRREELLRSGAGVSHAAKTKKTTGLTQIVSKKSTL